MKAMVRRRYGQPDVIEMTDIDKPEPADDEALVRVRAASVNRADWYELTGWLYLFRFSSGLTRPKNIRLGTDFAGVVEAVGADITHVSPGDEVFGGRSGALAEYIVVKNAVVPMPAGATFEEAAAIGVAGLTALQGLRDKGGLQPGHRVLINGATGGVGTFAVQVAKALGAEVTAVCSAGKVDLVRSLGADEVIDYTKEDFTRRGKRYDLIFDVAGGRSWRALKRALQPDGTLLIVGGPKGGRILGALRGILGRRIGAVFSRRSATFFLARFNRPDLETLAKMVEKGEVKPVVDRVYGFADTAEAFRYVGEGHARGKAVVTV